jgi:chromosome segregation ATPase
MFTQEELETKLVAVEQAFERCQQSIIDMQNDIPKRQEELARLQGEYRCIKSFLDQMTEDKEDGGTEEPTA